MNDCNRKYKSVNQSISFITAMYVGVARKIQPFLINNKNT